MALAGLTQHIKLNLKGALRLLRFDAAGVAQINGTWAGARFSFIAALLCFPFFIIAQLIEGGASTLPGIVVELCSYSLQWSALPLATFYLCKSWERLDRYPLFIAALNWITVWQSLLFIVLKLAAEGGLLPGAIGGALSMLVVIYLFAVEGFTIQRTLSVGVMGAVGIVILDLFIVMQLVGIREYLLR